MEGNKLKKAINLIMQYKWAFTALIAGPVIVNLILLIPAIPFITAGTTELWLGFFGNYSGGIIGGGIAFWVAKTQINELRKQEEEKKILSIRPYLRTLRRNKQIGADLYNDNLVKLSFKDYHSKVDLIVGGSDFYIENVGLGTAVDIKFTTFHEMSNEITSNFTLTVNEKREMKMNADFQKSDKTTSFSLLTVNYKDLLGNEYEQAIEIKTLYNPVKGVVMEAQNTSTPILIVINNPSQNR